MKDHPPPHLHDHRHPHDHSHVNDHAHAHDHSHVNDHAHPHDHSHVNDHAHTHGHEETPAAPDLPARLLRLEHDLLAKNGRLAERNRGWLLGRRVAALNLVSSPGAGKTTLLERTIADVGRELSISVIEGDQATDHDARRIEAAGARAVQINTGTGCHLDAAMVGRGLERLDPGPSSLLMIENVGNLVCPSLFDLGEQARVVIVSPTEGEDKPIKYPHIFRSSDVMVLNKIDLLPYLRFDEARCVGYARQVNPRLTVLRLSATTGEGLAAWYDYLRAERARAGRSAT